MNNTSIKKIIQKIVFYHDYIYLLYPKTAIIKQTQIKNISDWDLSSSDNDNNDNLTNIKNNQLFR